MHFRCLTCGARVTERFDRAPDLALTPLSGELAWRFTLDVLYRDAEVDARDRGCCGPTGRDPNTRCAGGHLVGRYANDCLAPTLELALDPSAVRLFDEDDAVDEILGVFDGRDPSAFLAWLHNTLALPSWHGDDLYGLFAAWARAPVGGLIVWSGADLDYGATHLIADAFTALAHHAPALRLMVPREAV